MPIIYAVVARATTVLAEYSSSTGNFTQITRRILEKIPQQDGKMSYVYDKHVFHYVCQDAITYLCMTDEQFSRSLAFAFLEDIQHRFRASYGDRGKTALALAMNAEFSHVLQRQMDYFSTNPNADKLKQATAQVDEVKAIMVNNIEQVIDRGDKIEALVDKTDSLYGNTVTFRHQATHLKRAMMWKNIKLTLIIAACVLVCHDPPHVLLFAVLVVAVVGGGHCLIALGSSWGQLRNHHGCISSWAPHRKMEQTLTGLPRPLIHLLPCLFLCFDLRHHLGLLVSRRTDPDIHHCDHCVRRLCVEEVRGQEGRAPRPVNTVSNRLFIASPCKHMRTRAPLQTCVEEK